jgi:hypothetical protein
MDLRRRMLALIAVFIGLLGFHVWVLSRTVARGDAFLSALLVIAIGLFAWRLVHYARRYRGSEPPKAERDGISELRQIRLMTPVLVGLLILHAWLITATLSVTPLTATEYVFASLLVLAVVVFVARLAFYARRYTILRRPT